jgi:hypothetical protein
MEITLRVDWMLNKMQVLHTIKVCFSFNLVLWTASMLCNDRINSNPESTVGLLTMAGPGLVHVFSFALWF